MQREGDYRDRCRWPADACAYAAARDAACWQLKRSEADVWLTLKAFDEVTATVKAKGQECA